MERLRAWARRLKQDVMTLWFAWRDPRTPWVARLLIAAIVGYALSPIDLIPDFIPLLGLLDELVLLPALIWLAIRVLPAAVVEASRARAAQWQAQRQARPRSLAGAAAIVLLWVGLVVLGAWLYLPGQRATD